ncbi:MAG: DNA repair protein RadA [Planctomycetota bacterium]
MAPKMSKTKTVFACNACGAVQHRWAGKCPDCGGWNTLEEQRLDAGASRDPQKGLIEGWDGSTAEAAGAVPISQVDAQGGRVNRLPSGIGELDRVLGGAADAQQGIVEGSVVLVGGEPGIGKSTLLLQAAGAWASDQAGVLYVSSEESAEQVRDRAQRLGVGAREGLFVLADTNLARITEQVRKLRPAVVVIDSIQMIYKADLGAAPGTVTQLRQCASELTYLAKLSGTAVVLVGHVTKEGQLAGPRLLEHLVDCVLYFEGDRFHAGRIVRAVKNRFGSAMELGLFEMTGEGLQETPGGGSIAAEETGSRPGSVVCPVMHGSRALIAEVQALTATGFVGSAKRKASGLDANRLAMLIAVLEQHGGVRLADRDVFASSVGGVRVVEPAGDLGLLLAIAGAERGRGLQPGVCAIGEVGLGGEIRSVAHLEARLHEAARMGYTGAIVPTPHRRGSMPKVSGIKPDPVRTVGEALERLG